jgi:4-aminobutyrate aminotransferase-like enzyme
MNTISTITPSLAALLAQRRALLGGNLRVSYENPLHIVRGSMQYLWDADGRRYLDAYNNVPHVGHCHPHVVQAGQAQMAILNTNTRYLHELVHQYAARLGATLPGELKVCYFVNSGSEANELALRLARAHTGRRDLIVLEHAYHGNTTTMIDVSPYKHAGSGGEGAPPWVHVAPLADLYRGAHRRDAPDAAQRYAQSVERIVERLRSRGTGVAAFLAESWPSVAGQLNLPAEYVQRVYELVRGEGGLCIADEVQTAYGRLGDHFWGFEFYGVVPDIVVLGKPIGNGHPIGAVVTTPEIAASFDNGMEFFSTFGGNTVSCAVGMSVLDVVADEELQVHAAQVGKHLLRRLGELRDRHALIGDVRGSGLFLGVELVADRQSLQPAGREASLVANRMRDHGVLLGTEGPYHNVLKIRPPMPFTAQDAELLIQTLDAALAAVV